MSQSWWVGLDVQRKELLRVGTAVQAMGMYMAQASPFLCPCPITPNSPCTSHLAKQCAAVSTQ